MRWSSFVVLSTFIILAGCASQTKPKSQHSANYAPQEIDNQSLNQLSMRATGDLHKEEGLDRVVTFKKTSYNKGELIDSAGDNFGNYTYQRVSGKYAYYIVSLNQKDAPGRRYRVDLDFDGQHVGHYYAYATKGREGTNKGVFALT